MSAAPLSTAAVEAALAGYSLDINAAFTLNSGYLVFFMHCGFAMLSIGCVRAKFAKHIASLVLVDACASAIGWYLFGWAFAFGENTSVNANGVTIDNTNAFIGTENFALHNLPYNQFYLWLFQWSFAATACTIVSGAIAERAKFEAYIMYSFFMASWVYPIIVHSVWSTAGWIGMFRTNGPLLFGSGAIDFAGSGVVHMVGGYAAAAGCLVLGPRLGRFNADGTANDYPAHNYSLVVLGVMILWFGWYGFNPGSQTAIVPGLSPPVATAAVTTTLAPAAAGLSALLCKSLESGLSGGTYKNYDLMSFGNGCLAGLVAITSGCSTVYPWGAICIGLVSGALYCIGSRVSLLLKLDDPLDAIAVHAWNGTWGVFAVGLFAGQDLITNSYGSQPTVVNGLVPGNPRTSYGVFLGSDGNLLACQIIHILWIGGWVVGNTLPFFYILKVLGLFRVSPEEELAGLDHSYHGGSAYGGGGEDAKAAAYDPALEMKRLRDELNALKMEVDKKTVVADAPVKTV